MNQEAAMTYSVIVPLYNEEEVLEACLRRLLPVMDSLGGSFEVILVNDGSRDRTKELAQQWVRQDNRIICINFSRNFGHQNAITAGMAYAQGEAVVVIDADLQDPPELIPDMVQLWKEGFDVVYAKRKGRKGESWFKKQSAKLFYRILNKLSDVRIPQDVGDFRLISRRVCQALKALPEHNRYVRGLISWLGFSQTAVEYDRDPRVAGESKYPLRKMIRFALDGLTGFSKVPLQIAGKLGGLTAAAGFIYLLIVLAQRLFFGGTVDGWASLMGVMLIFFGITLGMMGIIGEYLGRLFDEAKGRPHYQVESVFGGAHSMMKQEETP
jgi:glycosyltransferase involved in cell wall biosynthesis